MFPSPPDIYTRFGQGLLIDLDLSQDPTRFCFLYMQKHVHVNGQFFYVIELQKNKSYIQNKSHVTIHLKNIHEDIYGRSRVLGHRNTPSTVTSSNTRQFIPPRAAGLSLM